MAFFLKVSKHKHHHKHHEHEKKKKVIEDDTSSDEEEGYDYSDKYESVDDEDDKHNNHKDPKLIHAHVRASIDANNVDEITDNMKDLAMERVTATLDGMLATSNKFGNQDDLFKSNTSSQKNGKSFWGSWFGSSK